MSGIIKLTPKERKTILAATFALEAAAHSQGEEKLLLSLAEKLRDILRAEKARDKCRG